ncbi:MAG: hypothetical protein HY260_11310 [Chloroflexi bacterium]|nr:hypothetical protein [Chloroflexota bacterium]
MILNPKPSLEDFIQTCTPLLRIPELEQEMRERVRQIVSDLLDFEPHKDSVQNLKEFLRRDENFLGVPPALTCLSNTRCWLTDATLVQQ